MTASSHRKAKTPRIGSREGTPREEEWQGDGVPSRRTILLALVGTSPGVLTETIWALAHEDPPCIPDEIIVLTGNLTVASGGDLTLKNVELRMNCTKPNIVYSIYVQSGGSLTITDKDGNPATTGDASNITDSTYGPNAFGMLRVVLNRRSNSGNMHVDTSVKCLQRLTANRFHQLIAGLHPSSALGEYFK